MSALLAPRLFLSLLALLLAGHTGAADPLRVMPLGDSITRGDSSVPIGGYAGGYRTRLYQRLTNALVEIDFLGTETTNPDPSNLPDSDHLGVSGATIGVIKANHLAYVTGATNRPVPDVVLLHAGTNDEVQNLDPAATTNALNALIRQIVCECSRTRLIVAQIIESTNETVNARIQAYNQHVAAIVATWQSAGYRVSLVDMYGAIDRNTEFSDGYHPNREGYDKMGDVWFEAIQELGVAETVRGQTLIQSNATSSSQTAFAVTGSSLIAAGSASLAGAAHDFFTGAYGGNTAGLTDGRAGGVNDIGTSGFDEDGNWRSTYVLNTGSNRFGYDITQIRSLAAWPGPRANQKYELYLSFVRAPATFVSYGFHSLRYDADGASLLTLTDPAGRIASGVKAVRFDFKDPRTGLNSDEPVIREIEVLGAPTPATGSVVVIK